jgi:transglutaminase-like putative cysteine protease
MVAFARQGEADPRLRALAERITSGIFSHDYLSEYAAILNWVRSNIRYSRDPRTIEQVKQPHAVLQTKTGDCDDLAVLIAALVGQMGGQVRFVAGGFSRPGGHRKLSHVWAEAFDPGTRAWVVLDPVPGRKVHNMLGRLKDRLVVNAIM